MKNGYKTVKDNQLVPPPPPPYPLLSLYHDKIRQDTTRYKIMKGELVADAESRYPKGFDVLERMKLDKGDPERRELDAQSLDGEIRTLYFFI